MTMPCHGLTWIKQNRTCNRILSIGMQAGTEDWVVHHFATSSNAVTLRTMLLTDGDPVSWGVGQRVIWPLSWFLVLFLMAESASNIWANVDIVSDVSVIASYRPFKSIWTLNRKNLQMECYQPQWGNHKNHPAHNRLSKPSLHFGLWSFEARRPCAPVFHFLMLYVTQPRIIMYPMLPIENILQ